MHMVTRRYWVDRIEKAWKSKSVIWLSGVRRVGKTILCKTLSDTEYFDCELPRARRQIEDPQGFLDDLRGCRVVLDEVHRLSNPSELLKIAADHYPDVRILATGSSSLGASSKFRDTLTGRKTDLWLTPLILPDLDDFQKPSMRHRMQHGGLPPFFLSDPLREPEFQDWIDAYWAKDIQELFRLERKASFQKFLELILVNSGGIFEAAKYAVPCEVSRPTIANYLAVLEATYVAQVIRPYNTRGLSEIVSAPRVYAFDTGFVCAFRGWDTLRSEDLGHLWEHLVLNELQARLGRQYVAYWRDKRGHEVDFVMLCRGKAPVAIECKWQAGQFDAAGIRAFRRRYPDGPNFLVANDVDRSFTRHIGDLTVRVHSLQSLVDALA